MLPSLWLNSASSTPSELAVREGEQVLGRSADADICLNETFVSGYHARLNWHNRQLTILDLDSTNGTLVNGVPVIGWTSLTDGDIVEFGGVEATVKLPLAEAPNPALGSTPPPPPPEPSRRRPRPMDTPAVGIHEIDVDDDRVVGATGGAGEAGAETNGSSEVDDSTKGDTDRTGPAPRRVFGSRLGPAVSNSTEPLFDQPLTSAVTVPPKPPAGVSISEQEEPWSDYDAGLHNPDDEELQATAGQRDDRTARFDNRGLRITIGTAVLVLVALLTIAAFIIYFIR